MSPGKNVSSLKLNHPNVINLLAPTSIESEREQTKRENINKYIQYTEATKGNNRLKVAKRKISYESSPRLESFELRSSTIDLTNQFKVSKIPRESRKEAIPSFRNTTGGGFHVKKVNKFHIIGARNQTKVVGWTNSDDGSDNGVQSILNESIRKSQIDMNQCLCPPHLETDIKVGLHTIEYDESNIGIKDALIDIKVHKSIGISANKSELSVLKD